jgi:predicted alpha/beta hydrolase family esterase
MSSKTIYIVPRWSGNPSCDWYPWISSHVPNIKVLNMPEPSTPSIENWVGTLEKEVQKLDENVILVGHSVGAVQHCIGECMEGHCSSRLSC